MSHNHYGSLLPAGNGSEGAIHNTSRTIKVVAGYGLHQKLGAGSFATVYKGIKVAAAAASSGGADIVAIKAITRDSEKLTKKVLQNLEIEISILQTYRHKNIVCLQDVQKTERHFYLILEYCGGGDLQQLIRSRKTGRLSERLTRRLMRDLSAGLKFLWRQELVHRDIKPQNLLLTGALPLEEELDPERNEALAAERRRINCPSEQFCLKIADFGFARHLQNTSLAETLCGSPLYMAPEILQHHRYDAKADLWSVGTVLFEMIAGRPPFNGENHIDLLRNIQRKAVRLPPEVKVSKACVNLLRLLLNRNPLSRAGFKEFFEACDAFVALGCNGVATQDDGSCRRRSSKNLGSIPEGAAAATSRGTDSIMTTATTMGQHHHHQQQQQQQHLLPPAMISSHSQATPPQISQAANANNNPPATQVSFVSTPPLRPMVPRNYPTLQPLEPSPPGVMHHLAQPSHLPNLPMLNGQQHPQLQQQQQQHQHVSFQQHPNQPQNVELAQMGGQRGSNNNNSLQNSDGGDSGFVLVEHGATMSPSATAIVPLTSMANQQDTYQRRSREQQQSHAGTVGTAAPSMGQPHNYMNAPATTATMPSAPIRIPTSQADYNATIHSRNVPTNDVSSQVRRVPKGMLSTSPGTGGALMGMLGGKRISYANNRLTTPQSPLIPPRGTGNAINDTKPPATKSHWETQIGTASKILATAEDVGRRAVSVAHLGDARAYLALRLSLVNEGSSMLSSYPMEGVVEEEEGQVQEEEANDAITDDSSSTEIMATRRPRSVSTDKDMADASKRDDDEEEVEEMPFACVSQENAASLPSGMLPRSHPPPTISKSTTSASSSKHVIKPTRAIVQAHFKEALSCYLKSLQLLKGAITGAQKVEKDLTTFMSQQQYLSFDQRNRVQSLQKQCTVTTGWLGGQFRGVLERADAANVEISKLEAMAQSTSGSQHQSSQMQDAHPVTQVEELIYNHSLACGREGAVKQLLGQFEAARTSYRSAGLLAETLLMETNLDKEDRQILEGYVDGFAARITELDGAMLHQSRLAASSAGNSSTRSGGGIAGLIAHSPSQSPPFSTLDLASK